MRTSQTARVSIINTFRLEKIRSGKSVKICEICHTGMKKIIKISTLTRQTTNLEQRHTRFAYQLLAH